MIGGAVLAEKKRGPFIKLRLQSRVKLSPRHQPALSCNLRDRGMKRKVTDAVQDNHSQGLQKDPEGCFITNNRLVF